MRECSYDGCGGKHYIKGYCRMHHWRVVRSGNPGPVDKMRNHLPERCCLAGCDRPAHAQDRCTKHYQRWKRWGEADFAPLKTTGDWQLQDVDRAYLAGFIDGEGTIGLRRQRRVTRSQEFSYNPYLSVGNTNRQIIDWLHRVFGGSVRKRPTTVGGNAKPFIWTWAIGPRATIVACKELLPFLRMKRPQAELLIDKCSDRWGRGGATRIAASDYWEQLENTYQALRAMNWRGTAPDEQRREASAQPG